MALENKKVSISLQLPQNGIAVQDGFRAEGSLINKDTFLSIKNKADRLEMLASKVGLQVATASCLAQLIRSAKELSDKWILRELEVPRSLIYDVAHFNRVASALLSLEGTPHFKLYLTMLTRGGLSPFAQKRSQANDYLWEAELLTFLRRCSIEVEPGEPDLVAIFEGKKVGIACKKIYSEANLEKVFSKGVAQIEKTFDFGFVAFDLLPYPGVLKAQNKDEARDKLARITDDFIKRHERHFQKYLSTGRSLFAFVSTFALVEIGDEDLADSLRSSSIWMIPGLPSEKEAMFRRFFAAFMG